MFSRVSTVFRCHVLHVFYTADGLRLARETTDTGTEVASDAVLRVYFAGVHVHIVSAVSFVDSRGPVIAGLAGKYEASAGVVMEAVV